MKYTVHPMNGLYEGYVIVLKDTEIRSSGWLNDNSKSEIEMLRIVTKPIIT